MLCLIKSMEFCAKNIKCTVFEDICPHLNYLINRVNQVRVSGLLILEMGYVLIRYSLLKFY